MIYDKIKMVERMKFSIFLKINDTNQQQQLRLHAVVLYRGIHTFFIHNPNLNNNILKISLIAELNI